MQGLRLKFGDRRNDWKCCFCCHVRTGTIFIGIWHLLLHVLLLSTMAVIIRHPELLDQDLLDPDQGSILPTPQASELDTFNSIDISGSNLQIIRGDGPSLRPQPLLPHSHRDVWGYRGLNHQDLNVLVLVTFCTFAMTLLLLYGAVKGKPSYLMPFFCLQVFDFCVATISAVGYICYPPDMSVVLLKNKYIPFRNELLRLNPSTVTLFCAVMFFLVMSAKAYFIGVVWSCYKYLTLRQVAAQRTVHLIDPDVQNLLPNLPDLPDYETAVKKYPTPPPSYASAMQGHYPLVVDMSSAIPNNSQQPLSAQNMVVPPIGAVAPPSYPLGQVSNPQQV